ncbi:hypothetical protein [Clostridium sp. BL-8]|uniref:hypothetical protein n=1 Tax=Clostridium sp. BL-8 TaxID=349938 RepID=UPI00098BF168|nr:hypothetical protein [Clostridium sp. BL-8]OOM80904.1 hypothetical protein CLOBL_05030 [Clostridium sp. BL-8]
MEFNNATVNLTGNDELDLELLQIEISATYIDIFSSILSLIASQQAQELILQRAMESKQNQNKEQDQQQNKHKKHHKRRNSNHNKQQNQSNEKTQSNEQNQNNTQHPTPSEIATFASCLGVFTILIYVRISFIRLIEIYNNIQNGTTNFTILPNVLGTVGLSYSAIGNILKTIGAIKRVDEEGEIIIF